MLEDYEGSISLTLRTRSSKKPSRTQEENWKHQWLQPCLARHARKTSMVRPVARLMISSLNLRVSWKPVNPQECVWKTIHHNIMVHNSHTSSNEDTCSKTPVTMDEMERHCEALSQCDGVNKWDDTSTNGAQCAQCCAVISSVWVMSFTQLVTVVSM